jgi:hypothetical protein
LAEEPKSTRSWDDLIDLDPEPRRVWQAHELSAILSHQLSVTLAVELGQQSLDAIGQLAGRRGADPQRMTLGQLLLHAHPDPEVGLLRLVKDFARNHLSDPLSPLPTEVASVVYFAAIAAGIVHCRQEITSLDERAMRDGFQWALSQQWLDAPLRELFHAAISHVGSGL